LHSQVHTGWRSWLTLAVPGLVCVIAMIALLPDQPLVDEHFHLAQIQHLIGGNFSLLPHLPMPPGYHALIAGPASMLGMDSLSALRWISTVFSLAAVVLAGMILVQQRAGLPELRTAQILLCPLLWPFYFLLYTDMVSTSLVLAALLLATTGRYYSSAFFATISLAVRQTSIVWSALYWLVALHRSGHISQLRSQVPGRETGWSRELTRIVKAGLTDTWPLLLPGLAFIVFTLWNGGIAVGSRDLHQLSGIYPTHLFVLLLMVWILTLPVQIARLPDIGRLIKARPWIALLPLFMLAIYWWCFAVTHHHNFGLPEYHLRNRLLLWMDQNPVIQLLAFIPMAWAGLTLIVIKLRSPIYYWLFPLTAIAVLPVELIEQRYYIVPFVLWMLFRRTEQPVTEWLLLTWFCLLSAALSGAIISGRFFL